MGIVGLGHWMRLSELDAHVVRWKRGGEMAGAGM